MLRHSTIYIAGERYMERWILDAGIFTLRLHKFYSGDDDRASHTHPWPFITFPLSGYFERIYRRGVQVDERIVRPWRFHFRRANFEHIVVQGLRSNQFYTVVMTFGRPQPWGFYPEPHVFVPSEEYFE